MIDAKRKGKKIQRKAPQAPKENVVNLAEVLRKSLEKEGIKSKGKAKKSKAA
jgi:DNA end-binding protein Ku